MSGNRGTLGCNVYKGTLEIYKHGFVKTVTGTKYFVYYDGTPFFYLGDTHWNMYAEEFYEPGEHAGDTGAVSHFKYIVDTRVAQGFTVYQSEPIDAPFNLEDGFSDSDVDGFKTADAYYAYIAEKGLTHANAEFFFTSAMSYAIFKSPENINAEAPYLYLDKISRYWVARYAAYPVLWTLAQECDNDFYYERGDQNVYDSTNNPWRSVCESIYKYDPYKHPITAHQESTDYTTVTGVGTSQSSAFTDTSGHTWWASQWSPSLSSGIDFSIPSDYWNTDKVSVNYEGRYCGLWTKDFGARVQGWTAFLNGMYGYGYGAADIWLYKSTYNIDQDTFDGRETVTKEDKQSAQWSQTLFYDSAYQVGYMKAFLSDIKWWRLVPCFGSTDYFSSRTKTYSAAHDGNDIYVIYLYSSSASRQGTVCGLDGSATYTVKWFNPRNNVYTVVSTQAVPTARENDFVYDISAKPDGEDWVILLVKN